MSLFATPQERERGNVCPKCLGNGFVHRSENLVTGLSEVCPQCHGFGTATVALYAALLGEELFEEAGWYHDPRE